MDERARRELIKAIHIAIVTGDPSGPPLPDVPDGTPLAQEWRAFLREHPRLLVGGNQNRLALVKGDEVVSVWDTLRDAEQAGRERFGEEPFLVYGIGLPTRAAPRSNDDPIFPSPTPEELKELLASNGDRSRRPKGWIHHTELKEVDPSKELGVESNTYRREVGRLLSEGHEGRWVLIKGEQIIGIWDTFSDASSEGTCRYLREPFMVQRVQTWQRILNLPYRFRLSCPS